MPKKSKSSTAIGKAARRVYTTIELRHIIFSFVDRNTLVGMFRLEHDALASVAKFVYEEVHMSRGWEMSRSTTRGAIYCDAVRTLDASPPPRIEISRASYSIRSQSARKINPEQILHDFACWRRKFPLLRTFRNEHPLEPLDDAYIVHCRDGHLYAEVETAHEINVYRDHYPETGLPEFPSPLESPLLSITRHAIAITVTGDQDLVRSDGSFSESEWVWEDENNRRWSHYLGSSELDRRVVSVIVNDDVEQDDTFEYALCPDMAFLRGRQGGGREPWKQSFLPHFDQLNLSGPRDISKALLSMGTGIRVLHLDGSIVWTCQGWQPMIAMLDSSLPSLETLVISAVDSDSDSESELDYNQITFPDYHNAYNLENLRMPLTGLPNLRRFVFDKDVEGAKGRIAGNICRLGSAVCVFQNTAFKDIEGMKAYDELVRRFKLNRPRLLKPSVPSSKRRRHK